MNEVAPRESVQFARQWDYDFKNSGDYSAAKLRTMRLLLVLVAFLMAGGRDALGLMGISVSSGLFVPAIVLVGVIPIARETIYNFKLRREHGGTLARFPDPNRRLACVGFPEEFDSFGELKDEFFEPEVFAASSAIRPEDRILGYYMVVAIAIFGFSLSCKYLVWHSLSHGGIAFEMAVAVAGAEVAMLLFWPVSLRLLPGRLDIIRFSAFSKKPKRVDKIDLRKAKIAVDLGKRFVRIWSFPYTREFSIQLLPNRRRFAHTLFRAAMSTHEPGPLPDDALVG